MLDQDYDLMGLSRNNVVEESDWILDQHLEDSAPIFEEHLNVDLVKDHQDDFIVNNHTLQHQIASMPPMQADTAHHNNN